jgi:hypothetical protein
MPGGKQQQQQTAQSRKKSRAKDLRKQRRQRNRANQNTSIDFSESAIAAIAARTTSVRNVSTPYNISNDIQKKGAEAAALQDRATAAAVALQELKGLKEQADCALAHQVALKEQQNAAAEDRFKEASESGRALMSSLNAGFSGIRDQQDKAAAVGEAFDQASREKSLSGLNGALDAASALGKDAAASLAAAAAATAAEKRGLVDERLAASKAALVAFEGQSTKMKGLLAELAAASSADEALMRQITAGVLKLMQGMLDGLHKIACPGDKDVMLLYFCPEHAVYCEKERATAAAADGTTCTNSEGEIIKSKYVVMGGEGDEDSKTKGLPFSYENDDGESAFWPSICCETDFKEDSKAGWAHVEDDNPKQKYRLLKFPKKFADTIARNKNVSWGQIPFSVKYDFEDDVSWPNKTARRNQLIAAISPDSECNFLKR